MQGARIIKLVDTEKVPMGTGSEYRPIVGDD